VNSRSVSPAPPGANPLRETREKLEQAEAYRQQRKLDRAEAICSELLRHHPDYVAALHTLGLIYGDKNDHKRAIGPLFRAAMLNPQSWRTLTALSSACLCLGGHEMAAQILEQARLINPRDFSVLMTLGEIYRQEREYELAREAFREAVAETDAYGPEGEQVTLGLAACHVALGENAEAAAALNELAKRGTCSRDLLGLLSQLPKGMSQVDILAELPKLTKQPHENAENFENVVAFIRANALDAAGRHGEAWDVLRVANQACASRATQDLRELREAEQATLKRLRGATGLRNETPKEPTSTLFILGASRSGKTSLEALFGRLPGAKRGYENPSLPNAVSRTFQNAGLLTLWSLDHLPPQFLPNCRANYLSELARRAPSANVFSNTNPTHVHYAGYMATLLGNARFLFVKRNPNDIMLRIYMQMYKEGNAYAYDLNSIRDHVNWYNQIADIMQEKFPSIVRIVSYEDMVTNPADAMRTVAELCDLPVPKGPVPPVGDDRGCAAPYRTLIEAELARA